MALENKVVYKFISKFSGIGFDEKLLKIDCDFFWGDAYAFLKEKNVRVPEGFVITSGAFKYYLTETRIRTKIAGLLAKLDKDKYANLKDTGLAIRSLILKTDLPLNLKEEISASKAELVHPVRGALRFAVQCCLSESFVYQGDKTKLSSLYLNISGEEELHKSAQKCYAALFADEDLKYREENGIDHFAMDICIVMQKMIRSDLACSGVISTIAAGGGKNESISIKGCWGMMENIVYGIIDPDQYDINSSQFKEKGVSDITRHTGKKEKTLIYFDWPDQTKEPVFVNIDSSGTKRKKSVLNDAEIFQLANWLQIIDSYYDKKMSVVWAKDGLTNELYIVRLINDK
jgi:pyruvate,water dikinase